MTALVSQTSYLGPGYGHLVPLGNCLAHLRPLKLPCVHSDYLPLLALAYFEYLAHYQAIAPLRRLILITHRLLR